MPHKFIKLSETIYLFIYFFKLESKEGLVRLYLILSSCDLFGETYLPSQRGFENY